MLAVVMAKNKSMTLNGNIDGVTIVAVGFGGNEITLGIRVPDDVEILVPARAGISFKVSGNSLKKIDERDRDDSEEDGEKEGGKKLIVSFSE